MNFPLSLTILRIFFVPLVVVLLLTKGQSMDLLAVGVFLLAAVTDLLDGYLARKRGQVTALGILLDPLADKLLICSAFISLVELQIAAAWMVVIIVGRELAVSGLRAVASAEGFALAASKLGKAKMVFQVIAITALILAPRFAFLHPWDTGNAQQGSAGASDGNSAGWEGRTRGERCHCSLKRSEEFCSASPAKL
jgi:CDP-diacylglycerol---glycerol-3-phosphate 3-phosphatidyltransferase